MRVKVFAAFCLTLLFAVVCALDGEPAGAQGSRRRGGQQPAPAAGAQQPDRPKQVIIGRGSDTQRGSRMTITSDEALNDYSAYRSGDRFYVELPNANAATAARAAGKGFTDLQVQRRGKNVVLSYRVQPGAKPRVEQRFNRLEVVFEVPEGGAASAAQAQPEQAQPAAAQQQRTAQSQTAPQPAPTRTPASAAATPAPNAQQAAAAQSSAAGAVLPAVVENAAPAVTPPATAEQAPPVEQASPSAAQELAQAQPPVPPASATTTTNTPAEGSGTSLGAFLLRNWTVVLVAALLLMGVGLLIAARRSSAAPPAPVEALTPRKAGALKESSTARLEEARVPASDVETVTLPAAPVAAVAAPVAAAAVSESTKKNSKKSKKAAARALKEAKAAAATRAKEAKAEETAATRAFDSPAAQPVADAQLADAQLADAQLAAEAQPVAEAQPATEPAATKVEEAAAEELSVAPVAVVDEKVDEKVDETVEAPAAVDEEKVAFVEETVEAPAAPSAEEVVAVEETREIVPFVAAPAPAESAAEPEKVEEVAPVRVEEEKGLDVAAPAVAEVVGPAVAVDPDRAQAEAKLLLEGSAYDRAALSTGDQMARQLIAAELLSALAGRNAERRERARSAFNEFGYFEEKAHDLRTAEAAAERSSAARALGLVGDLAATPHLVVALEDDSVEVRRAAVESLANLRDPAAVAPLEELLRREKKSREKVNRKLVEHAVEVCREGQEEAPATPAPVAEVAAVQPAALEETAEVVTPSADERAIEVVREEEDETLVAAAPHVSEEAPAEVAAPLYAEGQTVESAPAAGASTASEMVEAETPTVEAPRFEATHPEPAKPAADEYETFEPAPSATPALFAETEAWAETSPRPAAEVEHAAPAFAEEPAAFVEQEPAPPVAEAPAPATAGEGRAATAGEWFEFDMSDLGSAPTHAEEAAPVFESSAGEPVAPAAQHAQHAREHEVSEPSAFEFTAPGATAIEPAEGAYAPAAEPVVERAEVSIEPVSDAHAAATLLPHRAVEPRPTSKLFDAGAAAETAAPPARDDEEKGVAPFDEFSSVPANIQQRLASHEPAERAAAVAELARVDNSEAFHQVCAAFDDEAREVRAAAARALFDMEGDRADSFTRALREAGPERRRNIGSAIAASGLASEAVGQLTGESREKTYEAFSLLFLMAKAGEVAPLVRAIEGHPNNEVRLAVVKLLALSGQKEILPAFRRLAVRGSLPTEVRSAVMEAIYQISSQSETTPAA